MDPTDQWDRLADGSTLTTAEKKLDEYRLRLAEIAETMDADPSNPLLESLKTETAELRAAELRRLIKSVRGLDRPLLVEACLDQLDHYEAALREWYRQRTRRWSTRFLRLFGGGDPLSNAASTPLGHATLALWFLTRTSAHHPAWTGAISAALDHEPFGWDQPLRRYFARRPDAERDTILEPHCAAVRAQFQPPASVLVDGPPLETELFHRVERTLLQLAMTTTRHWSADDWGRRFRSDPFGSIVAREVLWGVYDAGELKRCFRLDAEGDLADVGDETVVEPPASCEIGVVHAAELDREELDAWAELFADYQLTPGFDQFGRPARDELATAIDALSGRVGVEFAKLTSAGWFASDHSGQLSRPMPPFGVSALLRCNLNLNARHVVVELLFVHGYLGLNDADHSTPCAPHPIAQSEAIAEVRRALTATAG